MVIFVSEAQLLRDVSKDLDEALDRSLDVMGHRLFSGQLRFEPTRGAFLKPFRNP